MSRFDAYTMAEYVQHLRVFLNMPKKGFLRAAGLVTIPIGDRKGRMPAYPGPAIKALEDQVNTKAARAEALASTVGERYRIARDYLGLSDNQVALALGVSRELARRWGENIHLPSCMPQLAEHLGVPLLWLAKGGETHLPANSHVGVRVGDESIVWRENLYNGELPMLADIPDDADESYAQAYIERAVMSRPNLAQAARRAGGRWQLVGDSMLFAPWVPIQEHSLNRRYWSDEVEAIIQEALGTQPTVHSAWEAIRQRCDAMGLSEKDYPRRISMHKRVATERERVERYGVDINSMIERSCLKHRQSSET